MFLLFREARVIALVRFSFYYYNFSIFTVFYTEMLDKSRHVVRKERLFSVRKQKVFPLDFYSGWLFLFARVRCSISY